MVGTPERRHSSIHRRTAAIVARRAIGLVSPVRERDRRAERRRLARNRRARADAALLREMKQFLGIPVAPPRRRLQRPQRQPQQPLEIVISDTSEEDVPPPIPQLEVVDLDSSLESLPNIDPRPQWQLPEQPLQDLGPLNITAELLPPLNHQTLREAVVLLQRLQVPPLQTITPPPELPPRPLTPPPEQAVEWDLVEAGVANFDGRNYAVLVPALELQQPPVVAVPELLPPRLAQPQPIQPVDWALVAHALFTVAEGEHRGRLNNPI